MKSQPKFLGKPESIGKSALPKEMSNKPKKLTSPLKFITDNAQVLKEKARIAKYEPIAKKTSDNAKMIKKRVEQAEYEYYIPEARVQENKNNIDKQQIEVLSEEQTEALEEARSQLCAAEREEESCPIHNPTTSGPRYDIM